MYSNNRTFDEECDFITQISPFKYEIAEEFVPNMQSKAIFYVNALLKDLLFDELRTYSSHNNKGGGFLPAVKQLGNVASLPGIVKVM